MGTKDAWFKREDAGPQLAFPSLLLPSLAHVTGLLRVMWDGAVLNPNP